LQKGEQLGLSWQGFGDHDYRNPCIVGSAMKIPGMRQHPLVGVVAALGKQYWVLGRRNVPRGSNCLGPGDLSQFLGLEEWTLEEEGRVVLLDAASVDSVSKNTD
jgi:hypothetical protein